MHRTDALPRDRCSAPRRTSAQSPRVTPAGDPSVKSDSIYKLAVKPADYADQPYVYLLDDGIVTLEADGSGTRTYRQVMQILTPEAAEQWGEQSFGYSTDREKLTLNWARVLKPDGTVISEKPVHEQESMAPVAMEAPVYSDEKMHRISLGGVAPGTIVDYSYTVQTLKPIIPRDFFTSWSVTTGRLTRRSRLIVDLPGVARAAHRGAASELRAQGVGHRRAVDASTRGRARTSRSPRSSRSRRTRAYGESLAIASPIKWSDIAKWYAGLAKGPLRAHARRSTQALARQRWRARRRSTIRCARCIAGSRRTSGTSRSRSASPASSRIHRPRCSRTTTATARTRRRSSSRSAAHGSHRVSRAAQQQWRRDTRAAERTSVRPHDRRRRSTTEDERTWTSPRTSFRTARFRRRSRGSSGSSCIRMERVRRSPSRPIRRRRTGRRYTSPAH